MASYPRKPSTIGSTAGLQSLAVEEQSGTLTPTVMLSMYKALQAVLSLIFGGRLPYGTGGDAENTGVFDGQYRRFKTDPVANTAFAVPHGLGRVPIGFHVWDADAAVTLYRDTTRPWTAELVWLKANVASANVLVQLI